MSRAEVGGEKRTASQLTSAQLDKLIEEATIDAHDPSEQRTGLCTLPGNDLAVPFETEVRGAVVIGYTSSPSTA